MSEPLKIAGRLPGRRRPSQFRSQLTIGDDGNYLLRIDDDACPEFWIEIRMTAEEIYFAGWIYTQSDDGSISLDRR